MLSALLLSCVAPIQEPASAPPAAQPVVSISSKGLESCLVDSKDQGLRDVLRLLEPRLAELAHELGGEIDVPPATAAVVARLLTGPIDVTVALEEDPSSGIPVSARIELAEASPDEAQALAQSLSEMLRELGLDVGAPTADGLAAVSGAPLPLWIGTHESRGVVALGAPHTAVARLPSTGGAEPELRVSIEYGTLLDRVLAMSGGAPGEEEAARRVLEELGVFGMRIDAELRIEPALARFTLVQAGYGAGLRGSGMLPEEPLSETALAAVPEDALCASLFTFDLAGYVDFLLDVFGDEIAASGVPDPIEYLDQTTGYHLHRDVLDHLGTTFGVYTSDTTGASGLLSAVAFVTLRNSDALRDTLTRLEEFLNGLAQQQSQGRVSIRGWESGGAAFKTLTFPGLPVPLEPTWVIAADRLFLAASPQAALGAVHQALHGETSLASNPRFAEQLPAEREGLQGIGFVDTPRLLRAGYAPMALVGSALANATRSGTDPAIDAGLVLPPYHELVRGAKAMVTVTRLVGDDVRQEFVADRSFVVNATAFAGMLSDLAPLFALAAIGEMQQEQAAAIPFPGEDR